MVRPCGYPLELREFDRYAEVFRQISRPGKKLDGLVHCAGIAKVIPLKVVSAAVIQDMFAVNYVSFMELMKHFAKKTNSDGGSAVCMSAVNAHYPQKCMMCLRRHKRSPRDGSVLSGSGTGG